MIGNTVPRTTNVLAGVVLLAALTAAAPAAAQGYACPPGYALVPAYYEGYACVPDAYLYPQPDYLYPSFAGPVIVFDRFHRFRRFERFPNQGFRFNHFGGHFGGPGHFHR